MKKVTLLSMVAALLFGGNLIAQEQEVLISDDFSAYTVGNKIAVEAQAAGNDWWTTWSNNPGSNEDGVVAEFSGIKCGHMTFGNDQVLLCGGLETGSYDLAFDILVPNGKNGYFNILHNFNGGGSTWAMQAYLHMTNDGSSSTAAPNHGTIHAGSNGTADIPAVYDEWMHFRLHVDADLDIAYFYYSTETTYPTEQELCSWQWSLDSFGENTVGRKLDAMDFYPPSNAATSEYYLKDFSLTRIGGETAPSIEFDTDEIEAVLEEDDMMSVDINMQNTGTSIGDWTAWIDYGEGQGGSTTNVLHYDAEPGTNTSLVGFTIDEPRLTEVAAMFPGSAYGGVAMGTNIVSVQYYLVESTSGLGIEANTPLTLRVYGQGLNGQPSEVLAEKVIPYGQINTQDWTVATFDTPVALTGYNVWVSAEFTQAVGGYAIVFDGTAYQPNSGFYRVNGGGAFNSLGDLSTDYGCLHIRANVQGTPVSGAWATLSKPEGSIAIGGSDVVLVNFNSIGFSSGDVKTANVKFITSDPEKPEVVIPITMIVGGVGVDETAASAYSVYPNPTTGKVVVEGENISAVAVYNAAGQLVSVYNTNEIDLGVYGAGVYYLNVIDNANNSTVQRVVVK